LHEFLLQLRAILHLKLLLAKLLLLLLRHFGRGQLYVHRTVWWGRSR
jgi:hypothetical protein